MLIGFIDAKIVIFLNCRNSCRQKQHLVCYINKNMEKNFVLWLHERFNELLLNSGIPNHVLERFGIPVMLIILFILAYAAMEIIYAILRFATKNIARHKHYEFLQHIIKGKRLHRISYIILPIILLFMLPLAFEGRQVLLVYTEKSAWLLFVVCTVIGIDTLLTTMSESAFNNSKYHDRPIKGFLQISRITVFIIAVIIAISILTNKSPVYLIGGLGAFAAVLMLVAKDSIMGFVGGFLLLENDMVRLGDWIEIPGTSINGTVFDITLTIVKVRNWDNTIATIPPYTLINESFINWRGMSESGGRRIARGYTVKLDSIKPCDRRILDKLRGVDKELDIYIEKKIVEAEKNKTYSTAIETNAGLFRAYAEMFLKRHPMIRKEMLTMVRTLEPAETGLPIQFYCFTATTDWNEYEKIQAEIMEHFASVMPVFELYPFQSAGSRDTINSGLIEGQYPIEHIEGLPFKTFK